MAQSICPIPSGHKWACRMSSKTFKDGMKRMSIGSVQEKKTRFLFMYQNTQHATTSVTMTELLLAQKPRSKLDLLRPDTQYKVEQEQARQAGTRDAHAKFRVLSVGDSVFVKNFTPGATVDWLHGVISGVTGTLSLQITLSDSRRVRHHVDQIRRRAMDPMSELPEHLPDYSSSTSTSDSAESSEIEPTADPTVEDEPAEDF